MPSQRCVQELHSLFQELLQPLPPLLNEFICAPHKEGGFPRQLWDRPAGRKQRQQLRIRLSQHWSKKMWGTMAAAAGTLLCAEPDLMSASIPHPCLEQATPLLFLSTSSPRAHKIPRAMEPWCLAAGGGKQGAQGMLTPSQHSSGAAASATRIHGTGAAHMRSWL